MESTVQLHTLTWLPVTSGMKAPGSAWSNVSRLPPHHQTTAKTTRLPWEQERNPISESYIAAAAAYYHECLQKS